MNTLTAKQISQLLAQRVDSVVSYLLPNGKREGHEWRTGSVDGEPGKSLGVHLTGEKAGVWCDFNGGQGGDLLDLWAFNRNLNLSEAIKEAKAWLGIEPYQFTPQYEKKWDKPSIKQQSDIEKNSAVFSYLVNERKLSLQTLQKFKIFASEKNAIIFPFYRNHELINLKYLSIHRPDGKKQIHVAKNCEPILFGWQALNQNTRSVVICEGEMDAMTLHQYGFNALSVPFGGGRGSKQQWLENEFDHLAVFDEIYLCFDNDQAGEEAVAELLPRLGQHRCRVVKLPFKDANECLQNNISAEDIKKYFEQAVSIDPQELKQASSFLHAVIEEFYPTSNAARGISAPWERANGKILFRPAELSLWTGTNGHGKSQFIGQIVLHSMKQNARVCIASLELKPQKLLMRLTTQAAGLKEPSVEYITAINEWYHDKAWLFDLVGTAKQDRLLEVFLYARQRYGIDVFVIDSLMKCGIAEDDYKTQKFFVEQLCDFKNQYDCHVHLIVHPRKGADESKMPGKLDMKGTGALADLADNCFSVWRNKNKENEIQKIMSVGGEPPSDVVRKIDCLWTCDKQRNGDWEGKIGLWFDRNSYQFLNYYGERPHQFVQFSKNVD